MIFDTDVIIWSLRGNQQAALLINRTTDRSLSVVSYMELMQGARDKADAIEIRRALSEGEFRTLPLTEEIGSRASAYIDHHALPSGLRILDALVAATAIENNETLCSGNERHFRMIPDLMLDSFRPSR